MIRPFGSTPQVAFEGSVTPPAITGPNTATLDVTVGGALPEMVFVACPSTSLPAGYVLSDAFCQSAGTVRLRFATIPTTALTPSADTKFKILGL